MKHSIFEKGVKEDLFERLNKLNSATKARWGKLNAEQMLRHLSEANRMALGELIMPDRSNFLTRTIFKWMFLSNIKPAGREKGNVQTFPEVDVVKRRIEVDDIETEKRRYIQSINNIINAPALHPTHTAFGKMKRKDWGLLAYAHSDYHFTQFNI